MKPFTIISRFIERKRQQLAALRDEGGLFELRFMSRLLQREQSGVIAANDEARKIDDGLASIRSEVIRETSPADDTPGILDPAETRRLLLELSRLGRASHRHATHLELLT